jgi:hypothetical protein
METFYVESKVDLTILVHDFGNASVIEIFLSCMFGF